MVQDQYQEQEVLVASTQEKEVLGVQDQDEEQDVVMVQEQEQEQQVLMVSDQEHDQEVVLATICKGQGSKTAKNLRRLVS